MGGQWNVSSMDNLTWHAFLTKVPRPLQSYGSYPTLMRSFKRQTRTSRLYTDHKHIAVTDVDSYAGLQSVILELVSTYERLVRLRTMPDSLANFKLYAVVL